MTNYAVQEQNQDLVSLLAAHFRLLYNPTHAMADAVSMLKMFPGLRGLWPMSSVGGIGTAATVNLAIDISDQERHLTNNNNVIFANHDNSLVPIAVFDGVNKSLSRTDEAGLSITGTEGYIAPAINGLTVLAWTRFDIAAASVENIIAKRVGAGNLSYYLRRLANGTLNFEISNDGTATTSISSSETLSATTWYFTAGRFDPSAELKIWVNGTPYINTTSIPASIFDGTANFTIGAYNVSSEPLDGRISLAAICAAAVPDQFITAYYQMTAPLFGISV